MNSWFPSSRVQSPVAIWRGRLIAASAAVSTLALFGCGSMGSETSARECKSESPEIVCTKQGAIRGTTEGKTLAFKGIPYAKPPVGLLRWRAPEAPIPWHGIRDGSRFGLVCPQLVGKEVIGNEDCLTLNVWRPQRIQSKPLPVMIFLTGGGNHVFSGQGSPGFGGVNYNGELLSPEGVVYISFNNRLGALGFLAHPALDAERVEKVSGNYGSLDQIAMLNWVQQNIAAFGGDPKRVMLFGTSAGGGSICALMTAPAARGLFHRAAMQSSVPTGCELQTMTDAEKGTGRQLAQKLDCTDDISSACLRSKSATDIVRTMPGAFGMLPRQFGPNMDGHVFPEQPLAAIRRGAHLSMPIIIGNSNEETMQWAAGLGTVTDAVSYDAAIEKGFGSEAVHRIREVYSLNSFPTPQAAMVRITTDAFFTCQSSRVSRTLAQAQQQPVYRYLFAHSLANDPELKAQGAIHTVEHAFFFPWQGTYRPTETDLAIQHRMVRDWTQFARVGAISSPSEEVWAPVLQENAFLQIGATTTVKEGDAGAHCDFWDTVTLPWPHL